MPSLLTPPCSHKQGPETLCLLDIYYHALCSPGGVVAWWALCAVQSRWIICSMVNSQALHATVCISNQQFLTITNYSHCNISQYLVLKLIQQKPCCEIPSFGNFGNTMKSRSRNSTRKMARGRVAGHRGVDCFDWINNSEITKLFFNFSQEKRTNCPLFGQTLR